MIAVAVVADVHDCVFHGSPKSGAREIIPEPPSIEDTLKHMIVDVNGNKKVFVEYLFVSFIIFCS